MRNKLFWGVAAAALVMPMTAMAQETTSRIRGTVTQDGAPVAGAQITVTNVPSGTRSTATTDEKGGFSLPGLRAGGPFTVDVASPQGNKSVTDIYTTVQQDFVVPIELASAAATGDAATQDVVVTASSIARAGTISNGPATVLNQLAISKVASVNRDIRDIERRSPFATLDLTNSRAVSFAGVNPRFNRFTINGVSVGDQFGLNADVSPTARGPVPFDAIGQVSVQIAPYDFRQGNFTGGVIDTVLLAGTNEPHVTGFYSQSRDSLQGHQIGSTTFVTPKYNSETYGATFSGPIIKDKLFYMVSMERNTDPRPFTVSSISQIPGLTASSITAVQGISQSKYNYAAGNVLSINPNLDQKIAARVDWNLTDKQRLTLSFIDAYDSSTVVNNSSQSATSPSLSLSSNDYSLTELLRAGIVQLNSDWSDSFSTEARGIYRSYTRGQDPLNGRGFAQLQVCTAPTSIATGTDTATTCGVGTPSLYVGPDISRQTNTLFTDQWAGSFLTRLRLNNHELKLLAEFAENRTSNNFLQYSSGGYYFDSVADLQSGTANRLQLASALNGAPDGAAADFHYDQWTFGVQDDWQIADALTVSYGARYDLYGQQSAPTYNPYFQSRYNFPNTKTFKGLGTFQPRVSFNYKPARILTLRGGVGIFSGNGPDIYLSNSYSNTVLSNQVVFQRSAAGAQTCTVASIPVAVCQAALNNVNGRTVDASVLNYIRTNTTSLPLSNSAAIDPNFTPPSVWKANLSGDLHLFGIDFGADYLFTKVREEVLFKDIRSTAIGVLPDGRPRYGPITNASDQNYDILLTNTDKGRSHIGVVRFNKDFDWGLSVGGSYTLEDVKDQAAAPASTPLSNYGYQAYGDPNIAAYGTSTNQTAWAFKYNLGFDHKFFRDYRSVIQLFGETRAGQPYSFTMQDNTSGRSPVFGTISQNNRYLIYVPTSTTDAKVSYDTVNTQNTLDTLINNTNLKNYRGTIAPKNIARSRAFTRIDLHLEQEIPTFIGKSRISVFGDIENLPNLLNHNWGGLRQIGYPDVAPVVQVQCLSVATATGTTPGAGVVNTAPTQTCTQYRYSSFTAPNSSALSTTNSLYLIRVGARFTF